MLTNGLAFPGLGSAVSPAAAIGMGAAFLVSLMFSHKRNSQYVGQII